MDRWIGRVALVTGASSGIGAACVALLVKHGMRVIGCARNIKAIEEQKNELSSHKGELTPYTCDLRNEREILDMFEYIKKNFRGVDVCVCNAGLAHSAPLLSGATKDWREMLEVNVLAVSICTREAIKQMREKGTDDGHLFLMNSISGHLVMPRPSGHFYSATKFCVSGLGEGIRNELRDIKSHIRVTSISPGFVETDFAYRMQKDEEKAKTLYSSIKCLEAVDVADALIYALSSPPHVQVHEILIRPTEQII